MKEKRLKIAVLAWLLLWTLIAALWAGACAPDAGAAPGVDCVLSTWPPHQVPGPAVEFDGLINGCSQKHSISITVVGLKDGVAWANWEKDAVVCLQAFSCGTGTTRAKAWGCHDYQAEVSGSVDGAKFPPVRSGAWRGCR